MLGKRNLDVVSICFLISDLESATRKKPQIPSFIQIKLYIAILVRHIGSDILNFRSLTHGLKSATRGLPDSEFHANKVIFFDLSLPYWIDHSEFFMFDF